MVPTLGEDEFEGQRRFRHPEPEENPEAARPDWLTRAGDSAAPDADPSAPGPAPPGPPAYATGRKYRPTLIHHPSPGPAPGPPERMSGLVGPPGRGAGDPRMETDSALSHAHPAHGHEAHGGATHAPGVPRDNESWEGAVERFAVETDDEAPPARSYGTSRWKAPATGSWSAGPILAALTSSRALVLIALAGVALLAVMLLRPKGETTASIAAIRKHPERFEGRPVKVRGRVGEVFAVGGGYAFHLHQGREDIVVFTRSRVPVRREDVTISGSISSGILDGKSRQALFEAAP